jgi:RHS repeat-associated protein
MFDRYSLANVYNYFRDYDPAVGRYAQSDSIGLKGGANTYSYVGNRPVQSIDPRGLVEWNGEMYSVGADLVFGASVYRISVESECVNGKKGTAEIVAVGPTMGAEVKGSAPVSGTKSSVSLTDKLSEVNPSVFNGWFLSQNAGISFGFGFGCSHMTVGGDGGYSGLRAGAESPDCGPQYGLDASLAFTVGSATVVESSVVDCGCEK